MVNNTSVTLINYIDGKYVSEIFGNCSLIGKTVRTATEKGLVSADYFVLRIPDGVKDTFLRKDPLLIPQKTFVAVGEIEEQITSITDFLKNNRVYTVVSVSDNRIGSAKVRHWRADLK